MKTVNILLSVMAIAAGMVVGWLEHEETMEAAATSPAGQVIAAPSVAPALSEEPDRRRRSWTPGEAAIVSLDAEPAPVEPVEPAAGGPGEIAEDSRTTNATREDAIRLAAKARVFGRLLEAVPARAAQPAASFEVLLANGATIRVSEVDETSARYIFKLPRGTTFSPPREDVLEVRRAAGGPSARPEWKDLAARIAGLSHPIDMFIGGVVPCFQNGFEKEGLALLEKILARPDSDQVPLLFIPDAGEEVLSDWRLAAGRTGATGGRPRPREDLVAAGPGPREPPADGPEAAGMDVPDPQALIEAAGLLGEAQALYRSGAGREGREGDVRQARERLDRALQVLEPLPPGDEAVKKLRRQIAQLLSDVSRTASF